MKDLKAEINSGGNSKLASMENGNNGAGNNGKEEKQKKEELVGKNAANQGAARKFEGWSDKGLHLHNNHIETVTLHQED